MKAKAGRTVGWWGGGFFYWKSENRWFLCSRILLETNPPTAVTADWDGRVNQPPMNRLDLDPLATASANRNTALAKFPDASDTAGTPGGGGNKYPKIWVKLGSEKSLCLAKFNYGVAEELLKVRPTPKSRQDDFQMQF